MLKDIKLIGFTLIISKSKYHNLKNLIFSSTAIQNIIQATELIQLEYSRDDIQKDAERNLKDI